MLDLRKIKVVIADDSLLARRILAEVLKSDPTIEIVGMASDGLDAVAMAAELAPDVMLMDVVMPNLDGLGAVKRIMAQSPVPIIMFSALTKKDANISFKALGLGAVDIFVKPHGELFSSFSEVRDELVGRIKEISQIKNRTRIGAHRGATALRRRLPLSVMAKRGTVVVIGASTGGPEALATVLKAFPPEINFPILVVQHMAKGFVPQFAQWLGEQCKLKVKAAQSGEYCSPGVVYLAPSDRHMEVSSVRKLVLTNDDKVAGHRPSLTVLLRSVALSFGGSVVSAVLTGMGNDGMEWVLALHRAGGRIVAQDQATSVVYGMPKAAVDTGCVTRVEPIENIADAIIELIVQES